MDKVIQGLMDAVKESLKGYDPQHPCCKSCKNLYEKYHQVLNEQKEKAE